MADPCISHPSPTTSDGKAQDDLVDLKEKALTQSDNAALGGIVWRKLDMWILPSCTMFFLLAAMGKTNIGNARIVGMQTSLGMSNYELSMALTITSIPFTVVEFPITLILKYVGPDLMLPTMVTLWGIASASQGLVNSYSGLLVCRFFLGFVEGGLLPGIVLYLSIFYPRNILQMRIATFFASASLSNAFSGLLAAAIDHMNGVGGKPGWAWIFILEGLLSIIFGVISFFFLPRSPEKARFLTEKEREYVISSLKRAGSISEDGVRDGFSWTEVIRSMKSPHTWFLAIVFFLSGTVVYGTAYFAPTIVSSLGYAGNRAQLMSVPPFVITFVLSIVSARISDRYHCRGYSVIFFSLLQLVGFTMFYVESSSYVRYGSLFLSITGAFCVAPALIAWMANNSAPHTRRAAGIAVSFIMTEVGGIVATWLLGSLSPAPNYTKATLTFIIMSIIMVILSTANLIFLWQENRLKAERRQRMRKEEESDDLGDRSAWFIYSL